MWYKNHESIDELTNFDKMLITFDRRLLELNGVHFWRLCFFEVSEANIRFLDFENNTTFLRGGDAFSVEKFSF